MAMIDIILATFETGGVTVRVNDQTKRPQQITIDPPAGFKIRITITTSDGSQSFEFSELTTRPIPAVLGWHFVDFVADPDNPNAPDHVLQFRDDVGVQIEGLKI